MLSAEDLGELIADFLNSYFRRPQTRIIIIKMECE
jgi:hypothetical protein